MIKLEYQITSCGVGGGGGGGGGGGVSFKYLKIVYSIAYMKVCILIAYMHLFKYSENYTNALNSSELDTKTLNELISLRGIKNSQVKSRSDRNNLEDLITNTGAIYKSELLDTDLTSRNVQPKVFNSAGEFLESVEDSRDSVWLVHIVMNNYKNDVECGKSKFLNDVTWHKLTNLSRFGILTGTFNCARDRFFCQLKGWSKPQLVLGMVKFDPYRHPKELVDLFYYSDCKMNNYDNVFEWVELMLKNRLLNTLTATTTTTTKLPISNRNSKINNFDKSNYLANERADVSISNEQTSNNIDKYKLNIFYYQQDNISTKVPLYYSAMSVKYNRRAKFYLINNLSLKLNETQLNLCFQNLNPSPKIIANNNSTNHHHSNNYNIKQSSKLNTPIYLLIDNQICYNYGSNLNELPSYANLNLFLMFLYPDMNNIFLISFFYLNFYLVILFFEYNDSFLKQFVRGVLYLCIFNFILFSIWLLTLNSNFKELITITSFINSLLDQLLAWLRYFTMYNGLTQKLTANLRFILFYYIYIQPLFAIFLYFVFAFVYYGHTRYYHMKQNRSSLLDQQLIKTTTQIGLDKKTSRFESSQQQHSITTSLIQLENNVNNNNSSNNNNSNVLASNTSRQRGTSSNLNESNNSLTNQMNRYHASSQSSTGSSSSSSSALTSASSSSLYEYRPLDIDIDIEISVTELINQINGLTTIWLQSSTHADRLISELPSIEYCKCFFANTIRIKNYDETDREETDKEETDRGGDTTTTDDDDEQDSFLNKKSKKQIAYYKPNETCECGRNQDLKNYLNEHDLRNLWIKFRQECSICLDKYAYSCLMVLLPCGHSFHRNCIYQWFMNSVNYNLTCPICRTSFYKFKKTV